MENKVLESCLQGKITKTEAARQLGCSARTIGRKLDNLKLKTASEASGVVEPSVVEPSPLPEMSEVQAFAESLRALENSVALLQQVIANQEECLKGLMPAEKKQIRSNQVTLVAERLEVRVSSDTHCRYFSDGWRNVTSSAVSLIEGSDNTQFAISHRAFLGRHNMKGATQHTLSEAVAIGDYVYCVFGHSEIPIRYTSEYRTILFSNVALITADRDLALRSVGQGYLHALRVS